MTIKEKIKKEIDQIPEELLFEVKKYLDTLTKTQVKKGKIKTLHLKGEYDNVNIREKAYE